MLSKKCNPKVLNQDGIFTLFVFAKISQLFLQAYDFFLCSPEGANLDNHPLFNFKKLGADSQKPPIFKLIISRGTYCKVY